MPRESKRARIRRMHEEYALLVEAFPHPKCALDFTSPLQLLIATVLSAQTTDKRVNTVTPELFSRFPDAASLAAANPQDVEDIIHPLGFYRSRPSICWDWPQCCVTVSMARSPIRWTRW